jgi:hypothetical protein
MISTSARDSYEAPSDLWRLRPSANPKRDSADHRARYCLHRPRLLLVEHNLTKRITVGEREGVCQSTGALFHLTWHNGAGAKISEKDIDRACCT